MLVPFALMTFLGGAIGPLLSFGVGFWILSDVEDPAVGLSLIFAAIALTLGAAQGAVLVPRLTSWGRWLGATVGGGVPSLWLFMGVSPWGRHRAAALGLAVLSGMGLGACQAAALRPWRRALRSPGLAAR